MTPKMINNPENESGRTAAVIGGGLAGIAAAWRLVNDGRRVTLFERGRHLGGRAASCEIRVPEGDSQNKKNGERSETERNFFLIDNGQHLFLDACSTLARLHEEWGLADCFDRVSPIRFVFENRSSWRFGAASLPGSIRFLPSLLSMNFLTIRDRFALIKIMIRLLWGRKNSRNSWGDGESFGDFLTRYSISERARDLFWNPIILSALGDFPENVALLAAAKVLCEGLFNGKGPVLSIPNRPLRAIYHDALLPTLQRRGIDVRFLTPVDRFLPTDDRRDFDDCRNARHDDSLFSPPSSFSRVDSLLLRSGERLSFDDFILAVEPHDAERLLRRSGLDTVAEDAGFSRFEEGAITAVHLWLCRRLIAEPAVVLSGGIGQWLFCPKSQERWETESHSQGHVYHQVLISGAHRIFSPFPPKKEDLIRNVADQLRRLFPEFGPLSDDVFPGGESINNKDVMNHVAITTIPNALHLPAPSLFGHRPGSAVSVENLTLVGDWLETDWPSTLEGAVRSAGALSRQIV